MSHPSNANKDIQMTNSNGHIINTTNDYLINAGANLPNHSASLQGRGQFVRQSVPDVPTFRDRQTAYRYAAYLITLAEKYLPNENGCEEDDFEAVLCAIRSC